MANFKVITFVLSLLLFVIPISGCVSDEIKLPAKPAVSDNVSKPLVPVTSVSLPYKATGPAVIFRMDNITKGKNEEVISRILNLFAQNNASIDLGLVAPVADESAYQIDLLRPYISAGITGFSINYADLTGVGSGAVSLNAEKLRIDLMKIIGKIQLYYGITPVAFTTTSEISEPNYAAIRNAGFKIVSTIANKEQFQSRRPINFQGNEDGERLFRFPAIADVAYWNRDKRKIGVLYSNDARSDMFNSIDKSSVAYGVSVILLEPGSFLDVNNKIDDKKIGELESIIKSVQKVGEITTFAGWYSYATNWMLATPHLRPKNTPAYNGGKAVIFRVDDVAKGWHETATEELIKLFIQNGIPIDLGIVAFGNGNPTYQIPMVRKYVDAGVADVSAHGYDWTMGQFDTKMSSIPYTQLKFNLVKTREQFLIYYGSPLFSITIPNDFYNCTGFTAIQAAGFQLFSTHITEDTHPSIEKVDCDGKRDEHGMYRLPTGSDVSDWDEKTLKFTDVFPIVKVPGVGNEYRYGAGYTPKQEDYNDVTDSVEVQIGKMGIAVISIHPDSFEDTSGKMDVDKMQHLDDIIHWVKQSYTVTTFKSWYDYASTKGAIYPPQPETAENAPDESEESGQ